MFIFLNVMNKPLILGNYWESKIGKPILAHHNNLIRETHPHNWLRRLIKNQENKWWRVHIES